MRDMSSEEHKPRHDHERSDWTMKYVFWSAFALFTASTFAAGRQVQAPVLPNVGIDQQLGSRLNLDLHFRDESGEDVTLGTYFRTKPVILAPVYYSCPSLCPMTMNSLIQSL